MPDTTAPQVVVQSNAGIMDSLQAAIRYATVIATSFVAILGFLKVKDVAGLIAFIQTSGGGLLTAVLGLIALATATYGVFKTKKRGEQLVVAADAAPNSVAKVVT